MYSLRLCVRAVLRNEGCAATATLKPAHHSPPPLCPSPSAKGKAPPLKQNNNDKKAQTHAHTIAPWPWRSALPYVKAEHTAEPARLHGGCCAAAPAPAPGAAEGRRRGLPRSPRPLPAAGSLFSPLSGQSPWPWSRRRSCRHPHDLLVGLVPGVPGRRGGGGARRGGSGICCSSPGPRSRPATAPERALSLPLPGVAVRLRSPWDLNLLAYIYIFFPSFLLLSFSPVQSGAGTAPRQPARSCNTAPICPCYIIPN